MFESTGKGNGLLSKSKEKFPPFLKKDAPNGNNFHPEMPFQNVKIVTLQKIMAHKRTVFAKVSLPLQLLQTATDIFRKRLALFLTNESGQFMQIGNKRTLSFGVLYMFP